VRKGREGAEKKSYKGGAKESNGETSKSSRKRKERRSPGTFKHKYLIGAGEETKEGRSNSPWGKKKKKKGEA